MKFYKGTAEVYDNYAPTVYYATAVGNWADSAADFKEKVKREMEQIGCGVVQIAIHGTKQEKQIQERDGQRISDRPELYM